MQKSHKLPQKVLKYRKEIEKIDEEILDLLASRFAISRLVIKLKAQTGLASEDREREGYLISRYQKLAATHGMSKTFVAKAYKLIFDEAKMSSRKNDLVSR